MNDSFLQKLFSSDKGPSVRLIGVAVLLGLVIYLEARFATKENVMEMVNSNLIAVGSYLGIAAGRYIGEKAASTPTVDNSKTEIKSEQTDVSAQNINMNTKPLE